MKLSCRAHALIRAGPGDEGYVDALITISIQVAMDRLANAPGVRPDEQPIPTRLLEPLLPRARVAIQPDPQSEPIPIRAGYAHTW